MEAKEDNTTVQHTHYIYSTVSPNVVVVPIISSIFGFPVIVLLIICALRYRAKWARKRAKKQRQLSRNKQNQDPTEHPHILITQHEESISKKQENASRKKCFTLLGVRFSMLKSREEASEVETEGPSSDVFNTPEESCVTLASATSWSNITSSPSAS
ncbi:unnamed protein product [Meganyctiphanes norvegica]|uniref:Uncharacterized protein n=1 Tax=Meganyctiphanes norvegica TaxID=48144 RepID=A0AAV2QE54_MEGNR